MTCKVARSFFSTSESAITGFPLDLNPADYGYESHAIMTASGTGSILIPRALPSGTTMHKI